VAAMQRGDAIQSAFYQAVQVLDSLADTLHRKDKTFRKHVYAYNQRLGFLTSSLSNLGTAMQVSAVVRLPLLAKRDFDSWRGWCSVQRVQVRPARSGSGKPLPGTFELSNCDRLGVSEVDTLNLFTRVVSGLVRMERRLQSGQAIDALLAAIELPAAIPARPLATAAAAEAPHAAGRALSCLRLGLATGRLFTAMEAVGRQGADVGLAAWAAAAGRPPPGSGGSSEQAAAEALVEGILRSVVAGPEGHLAQDEDAFAWEEVRSDTGIVESRPGSGGRMSTVVAWSDMSANALAAEEIVNDLVDEEIESRMHGINDLADSAPGRHAAGGSLPEASQELCGRAQMLHTKHRVADLLLDACHSGALSGALQSMDTGSCEASKSGTRAGALGVARASSKEPAPLEDLRVRLCDGLLDALDTGGLEDLLQSSFAKPATRECASDSATLLRAEMTAALRDSLNSGALASAMQEVSMKACEVEIRDLRMRTAATLFDACDSGALEGALVSVKERSHKQRQRAAAPVGPGAMVPFQAAAVASPEQKTVAFLALQMLSQRDQRLGELTVMIRTTRQQIAERKESCEQIAEMIASAKHDASHLDLDIEWHRRALETAEERSIELGHSQRRLLGSLDLQQQKHLDKPPAILSSRSESSATTACTMAATSWTSHCYTPRVGNTALEPLVQRH